MEQSPNMAAGAPSPDAPATEAPAPEATTDESPAAGGEQPPEQTEGEAPKEEKPAEPPITERFAALARQEKRFRQEVQEFRNSEDVRNAREFAKLRESGNPLAAMEALGFTYQMITDAVLGEDTKEPPDPIESLRDEIAQLKEDRKKESDEKARRAAAQAEAAFKQEIETEIKGAGSEYDLLNKFGDYDLVYDVIAEHYEDTKTDSSPGQIMPIAEAARRVEAYLEEQVEKLLNSDKVRSKFTASSGGDQQPQVTQEPQQPPSDSRTLSNDVISSVSQAPSTGNSLLDDEASKRRATEVLEKLLAGG